MNNKQMNHIHNTRNEITKYFSENNFIENSLKKISSPDGLYHVITKDYLQAIKTATWYVSKIEIYNSNNNLIFKIIIDDTHFFHDWIYMNNDHYLIFAENMCGGLSVLELKTGHFNSFSDGTDGFICTLFKTSPNKDLIAIDGCYWACPQIIKIFDFSRPLELPYKEIAEIYYPEKNISTVKWENDDTLLIRDHNESWLHTIK